MTKYRGYYIDKVVFNSKKDIDEFIKNETIKKYQEYCRMFEKEPSMELMHHFLHPYMKKLHNECGLSYEEIEILEATA